MAIAGKVAITPKGNWSANTAYTKLDLVFYDNASYVAIQPSTGVTPTNTSYWMLVVQSAGGADLEAIINGTTQVGNAKTLEGNGAEYFFPSSGGTVNGNVTVKADDTSQRIHALQNSERRVFQTIGTSGNYNLYDGTNNKAIIVSTADGTNAFNGNLSTKPTGTYIGNGDATKRTINTGGNGIGVVISSVVGTTALITATGGIVSDGTTVKAIGSSNVGFVNNADISIISTDKALNMDGITYTYRVL